MSAVGIFGEFLVNNQLAVDAFLLCLLIGLIAIYLIRMLVIKPKKDAEISELIKKIEALESKLDAAGKVGVAEAAIATKEAVEVADTEIAPEVEAAPQVETEAAAQVEAEAGEQDNAEAESQGEAEADSEAAEEVEEPSFLDGKLEETLDLREFLVNNRADRDSFSIPGERFMSRTWGEDRHGNIYTEEMLKESIG